MTIKTLLHVELAINRPLGVMKPRDFLRQKYNHQCSAANHPHHGSYVAVAQPGPQGRLTSIDLPVYGRHVSPQTPTHSRLPVLCFPSLTHSASKQAAIHMQNPLASISQHSLPLILHFPRRILRKNPAPEQRAVSTNFYLANFKLDMLCEID